MHIQKDKGTAQCTQMVWSPWEKGWNQKLMWVGWCRMSMCEAFLKWKDTYYIMVAHTLTLTWQERRGRQWWWRRGTHWWRRRGAALVPSSTFGGHLWWGGPETRQGDNCWWTHPWSWERGTATVSPSGQAFAAASEETPQKSEGKEVIHFCFSLTCLSQESDTCEVREID